MASDKGTTTGDPKFAEPQYEVRCPDCELNGFLHGVPGFFPGRKVKKWLRQIRLCETCGGLGRLRYITREQLKADPWLATNLNRPGWVFVSRKETLDPYMLDLPQAKQAQMPLQGSVSPPDATRALSVGDASSGTYKPGERL